MSTPTALSLTVIMCDGDDLVICEAILAPADDDEEDSSEPLQHAA